MTIRRKLQLSILVQLMLALAVGVTLLLALQDLNRASQKGARVADLNQAVTQLRFVTFEHQTNHDDRSLEQWRAKYASMAGLLRPLSSHDRSERQILAEISAEQVAIQSLFNRLIESHHQLAPGNDVVATAAFRDRLTGQLLAKQQIQLTELNKLLALNRQEVSASQMRTSWLVAGLVLLMVLVVVVNMAVVVRTINRSLALLQQGAQKIGSGKLDFRITTLKHKDEFSHLASAFNDMAAVLERVDQIKTDFILLASHQLRTPATAVKGYLSLLLDGYAGKVPAKQADHIRSAYAENELELKIINQILNVAKIDAGEEPIIKADTNLGDIIAEVALGQTSFIERRKQTITTHLPADPVIAAVDPEKIGLCLMSLIDNATKYSPEHAHISVSLKKLSDVVRIKVADNGYGIAVTDQGRLFQKFSRLPNPNSSAAGGSGLGLYLVKNIIELHRGQLKLVSEPGQGTTVCIELPLKAATP